MSHSQNTWRRDSFTELSLAELLPKSHTENIDVTQSESGDPNVGLSANSGVSASVGELIGRFRVTGVLGEGGYGRVFKAYDDQLQRHVAIKVPHIYRISSPAAVEKYLDEARTLAKLNHPGIVAVYDVGVTVAGVPYIVSALVEGTSLALRMHTSPLTLGDALKLLVDVANALGFVHSRGIVHRDVKPGNILLNREGKPFLADFGLALKDSDVELTRTRVGTPNYMSPEQARGESHLVDGRSDIFSLGVVMYELLTGSRPFGGSTRVSMVYNLLHQEARPPRQLVASVPRDLERICLKMLAKRVSDRFSSTSDLVADIEHYLAMCDASVNHVSQAIKAPEPVSELGRVIPRGLRSYDRHDAEFFQRLLPGPRDREWVPESLRFWQRQIKASGTSDPPRVGVIYGPSGCGKSSFVKAGLLPLLGESVETVFVEATHDDTESRLLRGIRKHCPKVSLHAKLAETLEQIRDNPKLANGRRILLVIDQFEQWLHSRSEQPETQLTNSDLTSALRQCDGHTIQCLLLVRDDFWLALSRFMAEIEVLIEQNRNAMLVDLFSTQHARDVLLEFGVSYGRLPANLQELSNEQKRFLDAAAEGLSVAGKVFPVRLALFVEMVKNQPWTIDTLNQLGGVEGIGLQFLEESFSSSLAPAAQATHEPAVRGVLRKLLPDSGVGIKGHMQSEEVLLEASGYKNQPAQFDQMMRILDADLRLITPTDPAGTTMNDESSSQSSDGLRYYQLTHDFLVPAIEEWLTRKQRATRQGRAELRLAEYASLWALKPTAKNAPSWLDWITIQFSTSSSRWTETQRRMMRVARRRHLVRTGSVIALCSVIVVGGWWMQQRWKAESRVEQLQIARTDEIPALLAEVRSSGRFAAPKLRESLNAAAPNSRDEVVNRLALLPTDPSHRKELLCRSVTLELPILTLLHSELRPLATEDRALFVQTLDNVEAPVTERMRAAMMLADVQYGLTDSEDLIVRKHSAVVVDELLQHASKAPQDNSLLLTALQPIANQLEESLRTIALQPVDSPQRSLASSFFVQLQRDSPESLLNFFLDASFEQHEMILATLEQHLESVVERIRTEAFGEIDRTLTEPEYDILARRSATAAALLHRMDRSDATWPMLANSEWPHKRSYLIHRIAPLGGNLEILLSRYAREPDVSVRRALLQTMGEFEWTRIPTAAQLQMIAVAKDAFHNDSDVGVHSSAQWLLMHCGQTEWVDTTIGKLSTLAKDPRKNWYVNAEGQTMAVLDARGAPGIGYVFEISTGEVTVDQFQRFDPNHAYYEYRSPGPTYPANLTNWFMCVDYCRWLSEKLNADAKHCYPIEMSEANPNVSYVGMEQHGAYRMPTVAEWTYACAATTNSLRYYGYSNALTDKYHYYFDTAVNQDNEIVYAPAGSLKPNDFGMFAMYDGVREWGHESTMRSERRMIISSSSNALISDARTFLKHISSDLPNATNGMYGLRVARTVVTP